MTFIFGRNPELTLKDDNGNHVETIDLSGMKTEDIHRLLQDKGFSRKPVGTKSASAAVEP